MFEEKSGKNMKWTLLSLCVIGSLLAPLYWGPSLVRAQAGNVSDPTLLVLDKAVGEITGRLTEYAKSLPDQQKSRLLSLLDQQKQQLAAVERKHQDQNTPLTRQQLTAELKGFFATGAAIRAAVEPPKGSVRAAQASPDPSQCAEHCYRTCGYNSLGEKVCWYTCYRCCGKGGC